MSATNGQRLMRTSFSGGRSPLPGRNSAFANRVLRQRQQGLDVARQIGDDDGIAVDGMPAHRHHRRRAEAVARVHAGDVHADARAEGLEQATHRAFVTTAEVVVEQPRLVQPDQPCQCQGGAHVGQRVVCLAVIDAVGLGQTLQLVDRQAVVVHRPVDAVAAQGAGGAHQIDDVPPRVAVLPFAQVRVHQLRYSP
jgi:hypothetical protein